MKKLVSYLPLLLWVTISNSWYIDINSTEVSNIWNVMNWLGTSILDILIKFWPYLLLFGWIIFIISFVFNRFNR